MRGGTDENVSERLENTPVRYIEPVGVTGEEAAWSTASNPSGCGHEDARGARRPGAL